MDKACMDIIIDDTTNNFKITLRPLFFLLYK